MTGPGQPFPDLQPSRGFARRQAYDGRHSTVGRAFMHVAFLLGDGQAPAQPAIRHCGLRHQRSRELCPIWAANSCTTSESGWAPRQDVIGRAIATSPRRRVRSSFHRTLARPPSRHAGRIVLRVLPPGSDHSLHGGRGSSSCLTDQHDAPAPRHAGRIKLREGMIDGTGNVSAGIFVRLSHIHHGTRSVLMRSHEILMPNGRRTRGRHEPFQQSR